MIKNYLKIALRNIKRDKAYSFLNIAGLAVGLACSILILLWVQDELSFDSFHEKADDIYQVSMEFEKGNGEKAISRTSPGLLAPTLKAEYPEVLDAARTTFPTQMSLGYGDKVFNESLLFVEPSFLNIFSFHLVEGDRRGALSDPHTILITQEMAIKYFGDESPLGKTLVMNNNSAVVVSGVLADIPTNSSLDFDFLVPFAFFEESGRNANVWNSNDYMTYALLKPGCDPRVVDEKIKDRVNRELSGGKSRPFLFLFKNLHLRSLTGQGERMQGVYIFLMVAFFILLIACINFMNLATARSGKRAKEVGLRKVLGVNRRRLIYQFYGESLVMVMLAFLLSLILVETALPFFNSIAAKELSLRALINGPSMLKLFLALVLTGILAGSYPALVLSSYQPAQVLKKVRHSGSRGSTFRKVLVVFQFTLSIVLVISTLVIHKQLRYIRDLNLGLVKENVVILKTDPGMYAGYETFRGELMKNPQVLNVSHSYTRPSESSFFDLSWTWEGKDLEKKVRTGKTWVGYDFDETLGIKLAQGRFYNRQFPGDIGGSVVINEELATLMGPGSPVGKYISRGNLRKKVIGVVKNFHFLPVSFEITPFMMHLATGNFRYIFIKIAPGNVTGTIGFIGETLKKVTPGSPFEYSFLDDAYDALYRTEQRLGKLFTSFAGLAIFISCLGLFGLASFMAEQRTKEIGVRKVLGASVRQIVFLMSRNFTRWVIFANLIAWPVAYFAMDHWLQGFAYRTRPGLGTFLLAGFLALSVALLTVSFQSVKAALSNPVEAMRYE